MTYLRELVGGWCNTRTYILKPFLLQEVINIILDWTRIFLITSLAHRNVTTLMLCFFVFYMLLYVEITVRCGVMCCTFTRCRHAATSPLHRCSTWLCCAIGRS